MTKKTASKVPAVLEALQGSMATDADRANTTDRPIAAVAIEERDGSIIGVTARRIPQAIHDQLAGWGLRLGEHVPLASEAQDAWCPYVPVENRGAGLLWNLAGARNATTAAMTGPDGVDVSHAVMIRTTWPANDEGEVMTSPRWILWHNDPSKPYVVTSPIAAHDIGEIIRLIGPAPWFPPLRIRLEERPTKSGRTMLRVVFVP